MSQIGNITYSTGEHIKFAVANCSGQQLLSATNLPSNTIIIASETANTTYDLHNPVLCVTDYEGLPARFTYCVTPANGLNIINEDNVGIQIDNSTIIDNDKVLSVNIHNIANLKDVAVENNKMYIDITQLPIASKNNLGTVKYDNVSIKYDNKALYIDTEALQTADNLEYGTVKTDEKTIISDNGVISIDVNKLEKATTTNYGVVAADGKTINVTNGILSCNTQNLDNATDSIKGITKGDNKTIKTSAGVYSVNFLNKTTETSFGTCIVDNSTVVSNNGIISIKNFEDINNRYNALQNELSKLNAQKNSLKSIYEEDDKTPKIFTFMCNSITTALLTKSKYGLFADQLTSEYITIETTINTNCKFSLNIEFDNNVSPAITVKSIYFNDFNYSANDLSTAIFPSTNGYDKPLKIMLNCKNYAMNNNEYNTITNIKMIASYEDDTSVSQIAIFSIIRFNSLYINKVTTKPTIKVKDGIRSIIDIDKVGIGKLSIDKLKNERISLSVKDKIKILK